MIPPSLAAVYEILLIYACTHPAGREEMTLNFITWTLSCLINGRDKISSLSFQNT